LAREGPNISTLRLSAPTTNLPSQKKRKRSNQIIDSAYSQRGTKTCRPAKKEIIPRSAKKIQTFFQLPRALLKRKRKTEGNELK
jgi:hypothetical protein